MNKTLLYIDPGYDLNLGHYTREGELIREEAMKSGIELKHFVNCSLPQKSADEFGLIRLLEYKSEMQWVKEPLKALHDFYMKLDEVLAVIHAKEGHLIEVLMYTGHPLHLLIIAFLINKHRSRLKMLSAHVCIFQLDMEFCRGGIPGEYNDIVKRISRLIEVIDPDCLLNICTDSDRTKKVYAPYFKRELKILPFPIESSCKVNEERQQKSGKLRIAYIGNTIKRAGYDTVYQAYRHISNMKLIEKVEFKIKHTPRKELEDIYRKFVQEMRNITHITEFLSNKELNEFYSDSDIILLPYSKQFYPCQTSGVVVEAISRNKVLIVPENTWMSDQVCAYGSGETFASDDFGSLIQAIEKVVNNFSIYKVQSFVNTEKFRSKYSAANLFSEIGLGSSVDSGNCFPSQSETTRTAGLPPEHSDEINLKPSMKDGWKYLNGVIWKCIPDKWKFDHLLKEGKDLSGQSSHTDAISKYVEALSLDNVDQQRQANGVLELGICYSAQGRDYDAERQYLSALSYEDIQSIQRYRLFNRLGSIYLHRGKHKDAENRFEEALSIEGIPEQDRHHALLGLGNCYFSEEEFQKAEDRYETAFSFRDITDETRFSIASCLINCCIKQENYHKVKEICEKVLSLNKITEQQKQSIIAIARKTVALCQDKTDVTIQDPLVSVVVPCYNAEPTLKKTLLSVAAQMEKYSNCEVILVDDGSTDKTPEIISQFEKWDLRYKGMKQANRGVSSARNKGVEKARGDYIAFLDADDVFFEGSLSERMRVIVGEDNPHMLGVFCPAVLIDSDGNLLRNTRQFDYYLPGDRLYFSSMPDSVFNPSCVIVKKSEFVTSGGFDKNIAPAEDYDLWHRMMRRGGYFKKVSSCSIGWRQHSMSACHSKILQHYRQCKSVTKRVFSESSVNDAEEYQGGFGKSLYYLTITSRAFGAAILAIVAGQYEDADAISVDIKKRMIDQISPERLEEMIKLSALRALSKSEDDWQSVVLPEIKKDVLDYIGELNENLGGECHSLLTLKSMLVSKRIIAHGLDDGRVSVLREEIAK